MRATKIGGECPLFDGIPQESEFYFVHSYRLKSKAGQKSPASAGQSRYGRDLFDSVLWKKNIFATQFHPEKSQKAGLRIYANYWKLVKAA